MFKKLKEREHPCTVYLRVFLLITLVSATTLHGLLTSVNLV